MWAIFLILLIAASAMSFVRWRLTLFAILVIGFIQDPFRKLIAGEPRIFVVMVGVVFGAGLLALFARRGFSALIEPFASWSSSLKAPLTAFFALLAIQYMHSLIKFGSVVVSTIGLLSYMAPLMAVAIGYYWTNSIQDIRRFMWAYVCCGIVVTLSVVASFQGVDWQIFKEVGVGILIYDMGTVLKSYSGLMRTGEMAAWHIATSACFLLILTFTSNKKTSNLLLALCIIAFMLAIFLTGRRKMFMLFSLFVVCYALGAAHFRSIVANKFIATAAVLALTIWIAVEIVFPGGYSQSFNNYVARGATVYEDATSRFVDLGLGPVQWAYNRVGIFGGGLGIASQGAGYYGSINIAGGAGEGGLGKIMVELGAPGLIIIFWLAIAGVRYFYRILQLSSLRGLNHSWIALSLGFSIFLAVNAMTFAVATQLYGDIFVLLILGTVAGFVLAIPRMIAEGNFSTQLLNRSSQAAESSLAQAASSQRL